MSFKIYVLTKFYLLLGVWHRTRNFGGINSKWAVIK